MKIYIFLFLMTFGIANSIQSLGQQTPIKFIINGNNFSIKEEELDLIFYNGYKEFVKIGVARENEWDEWVEVYNRFKYLAKNGQYSISAIVDKITSTEYQGEASKEDLGLDPNGKDKAPNTFWNLHIKKKYQRMARLNGLIFQEVLNRYIKSKS